VQGLAHAHRKQALELIDAQGLYFGIELDFRDRPAFILLGGNRERDPAYYDERRDTYP
jgi:hypothetical protein